jgi:hypothetical protein
MFRFWLHFPPLVTLLGLSVVFAVPAVLTYWLLCRSAVSKRFDDRIPTAAFPVAIAVIFALFTGFLLANMVDQKNRAVRIVRDEGQALSLLKLGSETANTTGPSIRKAVDAYARSVLAGDWDAMKQETSSPESTARLLDLLRLVQSDAVANDLKPAMHGYMLALAKTVADSRQSRVSIVTNHVWQFAWSGLFILGFLTQFSIGLVHQDKPRAVGVALALYSTAVVVSLWLIAVQDNPFRSEVWQVSTKPFEAVLQAGAR